MEGYIAMSFFCYFVRLNNRAIFQNNLVASTWYYLNIEKYIEPILYISLNVFVCISTSGDRCLIIFFCTMFTLKNFIKGYIYKYQNDFKKIKKEW